MFRKGNIRLEHLESKDFKVTDSQYGKLWDLSKCEMCDFVFANPMPSKAQILKYYQSMEDNAYQKEEEGRSFNFLRIINYLEKISRKNAKLLDVGTATGIFINLAKSKGFNATGIEPSKWSVEKAKEIYGIELIQEDFLDYEFGNEGFDVVTLIDLIEHTPYPEKVVEKTHNILKNKGVIVIVTPDVFSPVAKILGRRWWHFRPAHLVFFTKKSLTKLLELNGFKILKIRKYVWKFTLSYIMSRFKIMKRVSEWRFFKKLYIILALGDSLEVYARRK
ncbi:MAG: class I SAM-dependent methyltransferase [Acidobacteriota bacterium]